VVADTIASDVLTALIDAPIFPAIQGGRISLRDAGTPVRVARWQGDWLGPGDGEKPAPLDRPVVHLAAGEVGDDVRAIVDSLRRSPSDVSVQVQALQTQRRIARGLIPVPTVFGADPALTRRIDKLGTAASALGAGEIALVDENVSVVIPHRDGVAGLAIKVDVVPAVTIAIEAPELMTASDVRGGLARDARWSELQSLARQLVRRITGAENPALPVWARRRLRQAVFAGRLAPDDVGETPILETTTDAWMPWSALTAQRQRFGEAWYTGPTSKSAPLDPDRIAFRLNAADIAPAGSRFDLIDASDELRLDDRARVNQKRAVVRVALTPEEIGAGLHTGMELGIDAGGTRGWVIPLAPAHAAIRGLRAHKNGFPFDRAEDPCLWPTISVVDDPGLRPDRTWSGAARDVAWQALVERIRSASARALRAIGNPPEDAIGRWQIEPQTGEKGIYRVGRLWIVGPPGGLGAVRVAFVDGEATYQPDVPVRGWFAVMAKRCSAIWRARRTTTSRRRTSRGDWRGGWSSRTTYARRGSRVSGR
jgi:hypothetical protein